MTLSQNPAVLSAVELRIANEQKSVALSYVLFFFLGFLGIHCFYLGRTLRGLVELGLGLIAWIMLLSVLTGNAGGLVGAAIAWLIVGVLFLWDLFAIPKYARLHREQLRERLLKSMGAPT